MDAKTYQQLSARTLTEKPPRGLTEKEQTIVMCALGLAGEAGEVAEIIKKSIFHLHPVNLDELKKEIGDVLWYAAALCTKYEIDLGEVMLRNIDKLEKRYPDGFNSNDSMHRKEN